MIYGYTRVSTQGQVLDNQNYEIKKYAREHSMIIDAWYEEKVSGTKKVKDRILGDLIKQAKRGDIIIVTELSRIGRSVIDCLSTINYCSQEGITLIAIKQGFVLDDSLNSKMISTMFSLISEIERDLLSRRVKEALAARKEAGMKLGRPKGSKNKKSRLTPHKDYIEMCLEAKRSLYYIIKHLKCNRWSLYNFLIENDLDKKYDLEFTETFKKNGLRLKRRIELKKSNLV